MGSILGGILGGGSSPGQAQQEAALRNATEAYRQYRPEAMQARLNAMGTISNAYQGANNALETMWGTPSADKGSPAERLKGGGLRAMNPSQPVGPPPPRLPEQRPGGASSRGGLDMSFFMDPLGLFRGG